MSEISYLTKLRDQMVLFLDELIEAYPKETDFVIFRIFVKDQIPAKVIMTYIVNNLCPLQEKVKARDEDLLLNHNLLFGEFDPKRMNKVNYFRKLWLSKDTDRDDKETIWRWFESFIELGLAYTKLKEKEDNS